MENGIRVYDCIVNDSRLYPWYGNLLSTKGNVGKGNWCIDRWKNSISDFLSIGSIISVFIRDNYLAFVNFVTEGIAGRKKKY